MPLPSNPLSVIVPVIGLLPNGRASELFGTGFMVAPRLLMSAKHVLGVSIPPGQQLAAVKLTDGSPRPIPLVVRYLDPEHDVAVAHVTDWPGDDHLAIQPADVLRMNIDVLARGRWLLQPIGTRDTSFGSTLTTSGTHPPPTA
jgi:hypothetical protein